jgi:acetylornithine deacetylase/succinyl-diaminopimelate desuccinylase-like protein
MSRVAHEVPTANAVESLMPELTSELMQLIRIPSISEPGFPEERMFEAHRLLVDLLRSAGVEQVETLELAKTYPVIIGEIPAPPDAPTVLLYGHYDVVSAGEESKWSTPPFVPDLRDGAIYGRGAADSKSNVIAHVGALRAYGGKPPVGIKIVIEGQEEVGSALNEYPQQHPELFRADAMLIADMGSVRPGVPTLTIGLRGTAAVTIEVRTLAGPKHSGQFGGAAPDALVVLLHALASLHDASGDVAVKGLRREEWTGASYDEDEFRQLAGVQHHLPLFGTGSLGERLWTGPAITVTGMDVLPVDRALNAVVPFARASLNVRAHPEQKAEEAQEAVIAHLQRLRPFGIPLEVKAGATGNGFAARTSGVAYDAARAAMATAWEAEVVTIATGGSIPLVNALHLADPDAEIILFGATDGFSNIHAPNERVLIDEFRKTVIAEAEFFREFADRYSNRSI